MLFFYILAVHDIPIHQVIKPNLPNLPSPVPRDPAGPFQPINEHRFVVFSTFAARWIFKKLPKILQKKFRTTKIGQCQRYDIWCDMRVTVFFCSSLKMFNCDVYILIKTVLDHFCGYLSIMSINLIDFYFDHAVFSETFYQNLKPSASICYRVL